MVTLNNSLLCWMKMALTAQACLNLVGNEHEYIRGHSKNAEEYKHAEVYANGASNVCLSIRGNTGLD